eukprot:TRINITY_DN48178_c0_g1_i1.p2 TRINITY_DN48178_c0_g1~~TRINITY_DN48178_c0_g1_i1.p2  ORF type:complete len:188 (-),score=23.65 TRINITY_DN48178_c0_g1_i1:176-739(-)
MAVRDTIEIIDGVHAGTTRLSLKTQLERFGEIDICHKIGDPREDTPWVRFRDGSSAQNALDAIDKGDVLIDGVAIKAQWRGRKGPDNRGRDGDRGGNGRRGPARNVDRERDVGGTSRDLFLEQQRNRGGGGGGRGGRSRSRSGGRNRRSRSNSRRRGGRSRDRSYDRRPPPRNDSRDRGRDRDRYRR